MSTLPVGILRHTEPVTGLSYISTAVRIVESAGGATTKTASRATTTDATGPARAVIFIPGWACQATDFIPLITYLTRGTVATSSSTTFREPTHYVAVDLPGVGESPISTCPTPSINAFSYIVSRFVLSLQFDQVVLAGHSMGHRIALCSSLYLHRPGHPALPPRPPSSTSDRLSIPRPSLRAVGIILIDPSTYILRPTPLVSASSSASTPSNDKPLKTSSPTIDQKLHIFKAMFSASTPLEFQDQVLTHFLSRDDSYMEHLRQTSMRFDTDLLDKVAAAATCPPSKINLDKGEEQLPNKKRDVKRTPVLVIRATTVHPQTNRRVPFTKAEISQSTGLERSPNAMTIWVLRNIPGAEISCLVGCGHFPHVDSVEEVGDRIEKFVSKAFQTESPQQQLES